MSREAPAPTVLMTVDAVGGVWRYAMDLAAGLSGQGVSVVFAGFGPDPSSDQRREALAIGDLEWCDAPLDWTVSNVSALRKVPEMIAAAARRHRVDLVQVNAPTQAAGLSLPVPVVAVSHSCVPTWFAVVRGGEVPPAWGWHRRLNMQGFRAADVVVAPSRAQASQIEATYGEQPHLRVVPNASRLVAGADRPREGFVLAAGRWWDEGKNASVLDRAAATIRAPVIMAGATVGPGGEAVKLGAAQHWGPLPPAEVADLMQRASIFIAPSLYEPFGLAVLEAARCGLPLVLADIPTFREVWDGAAAFFPPRDAEALAVLVNDLLDDPQRCRRMGEAAQLASQPYTPEAQAREMAAIYAGLHALPEVFS